MAPSDPDPVQTDVFSGPVDGLEVGLNPAQVDAVTHPTGPLLVVAGAVVALRERRPVLTPGR